MGKLHILVEGCLDAALAEWLAENTYIDVEVEQAGGWPGVVRQLVGLTLASRVTILGIIDADKDINKRIYLVKKLVRRYANKKRLIAEIRLEHNQPLPPVLEVILRSRTGENNERTGYISFWCDSTNCRGTVEDILREMLKEKHGYEPAEVPKATSCPNNSYSDVYAKYEPVLLLSACAKRGGAPVLVPAEHHCGIDVKAALDELDLATTHAARRYQRLLRSIRGR